MTALQSALAPRRNEILSIYYRYSPYLSLISPVPRLHRCLHIHIHVSMCLMYPLYRISAATIVRHPSPPLNLPKIPILFRISAASVVIFQNLFCGPHCIVFHCPASLNTVIFIHMSCASLSNYSLSIPLPIYLIYFISYYFGDMLSLPPYLSLYILYLSIYISISLSLSLFLSLSLSLS